MKQVSLVVFIVFWSVVGTLFVLSLLVPAAGHTPLDEAVYSMEDIAQHNEAGDCWMAIKGQVYDFSKFIPKHPAPPAIMATWCGKDATQGMKTKGYGANHSPAAWAMAEDYRIGVLKENKVAGK